MGGELLRHLITVSVGTSLLIVILLALTPLLRRRYPAKWRCAAWLLLAVRLLIPFAAPLPGPAAVEIPLPQSAVSAPLPPQAAPETGAPADMVEAQTQETAGGAPDESAAAQTPQAASAARPVVQLTLWQALGIAWLAGCAVFVGLHILGYRHYLAALQRSEHRPVPRHIRETLWELGVDMGVCNLPEVIITEQAAAPVLLGLSHPRLLLPHDRYSSEEFAFILRHELVHHRRRDLWYKLVLLAANAVHWFNPLVWVLAVQAGKDIELACDDAVVRELDDDARARYGDTILAALPRTRRLEPVLSTHFGSTMKNMKGRLFNLFDLSAKRRGIAALCAVAVGAVILAGTVTFTAAADRGADITGPDPEREIAGTVSVSIDAIAPDQAICIGRLDLRADRRILPHIAAASGKGLLFGLHTRPDITNISDPSVAFSNGFAGSSGSLVGNAFVGDDSGFYYVYLGSTGGRLSGITGSIVMEPYLAEPQQTPAAPEVYSGAAAGDDPDPDLQWMRTSYYLEDDNEARSALVDGYRYSMPDTDLGGVRAAELAWEPNTLAHFYELDADLLALHTTPLYVTRMLGEAGYYCNVFGVENGVCKMHSFTSSAADHDLNAVIGTVRPLLERGGFRIVTTSAARVRVDLGRRGADSKATGRVYEAIRFQDAGGNDAFYLLQTPSGDSDFAAGQLVTADRLRTRPATEVARTTLPVSVASVPSGGLVRLGQIAVTGPDMRYSVSVQSGAGLYVTLSKENHTETTGRKQWNYYIQHDGAGGIDHQWENVQTGEYYVYVGTGGSALTGVSGGITFTGTVISAAPPDDLTPQPAAVPASQPGSGIPRQTGSGVQKVNLYGLGDGVADSSLNDYDRECITIMEYSGTWGDNVERLLPSMTAGGVEKVVAIYLEKHLFPGITLPQNVPQVRSTLQNALGYLSADARRTAEEIIASFE